MFELKKNDLNLIYGGKKVKTSAASGTTENCSYYEEDGYVDSNENGVQDCGENNYAYKEWDCCDNGGAA